MIGLFGNSKKQRELEARKQSIKNVVNVAFFVLLAAITGCYGVGMLSKDQAVIMGAIPFFLWMLHALIIDTLYD